MPSKLIYVFAYESKVFISFSSQILFHSYIYISRFLCPLSVDGHLDHFHILDVVNSATIDVNSLSD